MNLQISNPLPMDITTYYVMVNSFVSEEMRQWIDEHDSRGRVWLGGHGLHFEREEDAAWFRLKWA